MNYQNLYVQVIFVIISLSSITAYGTLKAHPMKLYIMVGSVRDTRMGANIAQQIKAMIDKRPEISAEIVDLAAWPLPFYTDVEAPRSRKKPITDPLLQKWSEKIQQAEAFLIVSPEYNAGYPAPLKNALDSLYKEWNNKPVAFAGYSGGSSGGSSMIAQMRQVADELKMICIATDVKIPQSWKAFGKDGKLVHADTIEKEVQAVIDELLEAKKKTLR